MATPVIAPESCTTEDEPAPRPYPASAPRPTDAATPSPCSREGPNGLVPVFTGRRAATNAAGIALWLAALAFFWQWWLRPEHLGSVWRYTAVTVVLVWVTLIPAYFIFVFARARVPAAGASVPDGARVAIVVTKTPSEPFALVRKTLLAALVQEEVPHDTWLADEDPDGETLGWCRTHGVRVSSRKGIPEYHRSTWPRRTRSKEGNLAYFYDTFGYERYDFVSQFDADHVPAPDYLKHAIPPFGDPAVGYVSAPSICDSNAGESWSARGRLYVEASMHGALQTGYNAGLAPLCIGSHYSVRTSALRAVGGLGPELAEDHSTTLLLNAGGWKGVHAVDAIARGEGPESFAALAVQEFQWSRSLVTILLDYSSRYVPLLPWRLRFQFLFSQLWYPMFAAMMVLMFVMPVVALVTGQPLANVTYAGFVLHMLPLSTFLLLLAYWWRSTGLFRPRDAKIVSWEGLAFLLLRWPWSLIGSLAALWDRWNGTVADFRVTPKGHSRSDLLPKRVVAPYVLLSLLASVTAWAVSDPGAAAGFYAFNIVNAAVYGSLAMLVCWRHALENGLSLLRLSACRPLLVVPLLASWIAMAGAIRDNGPRALAAMNIGISAITLTETVYPVAGAALGRPGKPVVRLRPRWHGFSSNSRTTGPSRTPFSPAAPGNVEWH